MEEKDVHLPITPGLPEALDPQIGNGAAFAKNQHDYTLLSADPTKALESLLPPVVVDSKDSFQAKEEQPEKEVTPPSDIIPASSSDSLKAEETISPKKTKKAKPAEAKDAPDAGKPDTQDLPSGQSAEQPETDISKAPKPGKRIRKAAKAVQKQQKTKKEASQKPIAKKAPAKKAPARKKTVSEAPAGKIKAEPTPEKKVTPKATPKRDIFNLSPFTQWLKELGGADYVHPYDDDFALKQEEGALNEVISETYANLLATQGYKERAIEMYLKLIEKYPEKSSFFAAKIEALQ